MEPLHLRDVDHHFISVSLEDSGIWSRLRWFTLQMEKIQRMPPWKYLGLEITKRTIVPQKLETRNSVRTLADLQQLCGSLNCPNPRPQQGDMFLAQVIILLCLAVAGCLWIVSQPQNNIWKTLAQALGQDHICLSTSSAADPFLSCLMGNPYKLDGFCLTFPNPTASPSRKAHSFTICQLDTWRSWVRLLPIMDQNLQELDLLRSSPAFTCIHFSVTPDPQARPDIEIKQHIKEYTDEEWCRIPMFSTTDNRPHVLPKGNFLICGNWAWAGIPPHLIGGPCTFGQLSLFTLNQTQISHWQNQNKISQLCRSKRDTDFTNLDENCNSEIIHWSKPKGIATIAFLPWVAITHAFGELAGIECWVAKQANITSTALAGLLSDEEVTRQATLQNRAAIDFLLLLHGHSCEEFEDLCCMNLTSKAGDVRKAISKMQNMIKDIKRETGDWLNNIFGGWGISGWVSSVIKTGLLILFILILVLIMFGILRRVVSSLIAKALTIYTANPAAFLPA